MLDPEAESKRELNSRARWQEAKAVNEERDPFCHNFLSQYGTKMGDCACGVSVAIVVLIVVLILAAISAAS